LNITHAVAIRVAERCWIYLVDAAFFEVGSLLVVLRGDLVDGSHVEGDGNTTLLISVDFFFCSSRWKIVQ